VLVLCGVQGIRDLKIERIWPNHLSAGARMPIVVLRLRKKGSSAAMETGVRQAAGGARGALGTRI
jgi:hypothetical protein